MPNLLFPGERCCAALPKSADAAERMAMFPSPPVEAYVSPLGCIETAHTTPDMPQIVSG